MSPVLTATVIDRIIEATTPEEVIVGVLVLWIGGITYWIARG